MAHSLRKEHVKLPVKDYEDMVSSSMRGSIQVIQMAKKIVELEALLAQSRRDSELLQAKLKEAGQHLGNMQDELTAIFNRENAFGSTQFAEEFVDALRFAEKTFGRKNDIELFVKDWLESEDSLNF